MWRAIICALSLALTTGNVWAQTEKNAAFLVEQCRPLATFRGDLSDPAFSKSNPGDIAKMTYCVGFLDALIASLERNHAMYRVMLPDPKLLQTDKATAGKYMVANDRSSAKVCKSCLRVRLPSYF
jgi:hypothetical protein